MKDPTSILSESFFQTAYMTCTCGARLSKKQAVTHECIPAANQPIEHEGVPMPKALKEVVASTRPAVAEPPRLESAAREYAESKVQLELIEARMKELRGDLEKGLSKLADPEISVTYSDAEGKPRTEVLYLCPTESKSFDLEAAREMLSKGELEKLKPFIAVVEKFELKSAEKLIDLTRFQKFIAVKKGIQIRFKKAGEN